MDSFTSAEDLDWDVSLGSEVSVL